MKQIIYQNSKIFAATTLKDTAALENNNMALHVCIDPEKVMENRKALACECGIPLENWALSWQKHTDAFYEIKKEDIGAGAYDKNTSIMQVDALYTCEPNVLIGVFTADCVGMILADEENGCIAAIHSGWKGTVSAITYKTAKHLFENKKMDPKTTQVYFSPSILFDSLEVGMEVIDQIRALKCIDPSPYIRIASSEKGFIDNQGLNMAMLEALGVPKENLHPSSLDTKKELTDCFSFRNDKQTGEHFTYAFLQSNG
jgi:hypothetical protein